MFDIAVGIKMSQANTKTFADELTRYELIACNVP